MLEAVTFGSCCGMLRATWFQVIPKIKISLGTLISQPACINFVLYMLTGSGSDDDSEVFMRDMMEWTHVCDGGIACLGSNTTYDNKAFCITKNMKMSIVLLVTLMIV
ncbi:hypothetical protein Hanom_Chr05g00443341 [Helianthus anomalus]